MPTRTYRAWQLMKNRCNNAAFSGADNYSSLDIDYPSRWNNFKVFQVDMGECPAGYQLDRLDNDNGYSKENCAWRTQRDNLRNSSKTKLTARKVQLLKGLLRARNPKVGKYHAYGILSKVFGVAVSTVGNIADGHIWADIK